MDTTYIDTEVFKAYLIAKLIDGTFHGTFWEWNAAAQEAAKTYLSDPCQLQDKASSGDPRD